jgi:chromosome segregation ATPase
LTTTAEDDAQRFKAIADDLGRSIALLKTQLIEREKQLAQAENALRQRREEIEQMPRAEQETRDETNALRSILEDKVNHIDEPTKELAKRVQIALTAAIQTLRDAAAGLDDHERLLQLSPEGFSPQRADQSGEQEKAGDLSKLLKRKAAEVEREAEAHRLTAAALADAETQIVERFSELVILTRMLGEQQDVNAQEKQFAEWLRQIYAAQGNIAWRWRFLPRSWQARHLLRRLAKRGLFDAGAYLRQNPDVAASGMDPLRHYILHGSLEGRTF